MLIAHKVTSMSGETAIPSIKAESADAYLCVICQHCVASFQYWFLHSLKQPHNCLQTVFFQPQPDPTEIRWHSRCNVLQPWLLCRIAEGFQMKMFRGGWTQQLKSCLISENAWGEACKSHNHAIKPILFKQSLLQCSYTKSHRTAVFVGMPSELVEYEVVFAWCIEYIMLHLPHMYHAAA